MIKTKNVKKMIVGIMTVVCIFTTFLRSNTVLAANNYESGIAVVTTSSNLNVRSGPGTNYSKVGSLAGGTVVTYDAVSGDWLHTSSGWICGTYTGALYGGCILYANITTNSGCNVYMRQGPSTSYSIKTKIASGKTVEVWYSYNGWTYVKYNGTFGWVCSQYVR